MRKIRNDVIGRYEGYINALIPYKEVNSGKLYDLRQKHQVSSNIITALVKADMLQRIGFGAYKVNIKRDENLRVLAIRAASLVNKMNQNYKKIRTKQEQRAVAQRLEAVKTIEPAIKSNMSWEQAEKQNLVSIKRMIREKDREDLEQFFIDHNKKHDIIYGRIANVYKELDDKIERIRQHVGKFSEYFDALRRNGADLEKIVKREVGQEISELTRRWDATYGEAFTRLEIINKRLEIVEKRREQGQVKKKIINVLKSRSFRLTALYLLSALIGFMLALILL